MAAGTGSDGVPPGPPASSSRPERTSTSEAIHASAPQARAGPGCAAAAEGAGGSIASSIRAPLRKSRARWRPAVRAAQPLHAGAVPRFRPSGGRPRRPVPSCPACSMRPVDLARPARRKRTRGARGGDLPPISHGINALGPAYRKGRASGNRVHAGAAARRAPAAPVRRPRSRRRPACAPRIRRPAPSARSRCGPAAPRGRRRAPRG